MSFFSKKPKSILKTYPLSIHWTASDPFTFVSHHEDQYPHGNRQLAPPYDMINGRNLGRDYRPRFGFRMYHGSVVPGFPMHAHWGYETLTIAEKGFVDHFDVEGNHGRFGNGDAQWTMASKKYEHCEMYPLLDQEKDNPVHITQIMINIPLDRKNLENEVNNVWCEDIPVVKEDGKTVTIYCGSYCGKETYSPNRLSWAKKENSVRILKIVLEAGHEMSFEPADSGIERNAYILNGDNVHIDGIPIKPLTRAKMDPKIGFTVSSGEEETTFWILEGKPIDQKMAAYGPVILKDTKEIRDAMEEIRRHEFEEWPWDVIDMTEPIEMGRELHRKDGSIEMPKTG